MLPRQRKNASVLPSGLLPTRASVARRRPSMGDIVLWMVQRFGLRVGLLFVCSSLLIGGLKFYEHVSYIPTPATVAGTVTRCEMSNRLAGRSITETIIDCSAVDRFKAQHP